MKNFLLAIVIAVAAAFVVPAPASAGNAELFAQIRADVAELHRLLDIVSEGVVNVGYDYTVPLPAATRSAMITRMLELRTSIKNNLNALTVE
jgi:hypothetical protein